MPAFGAPASVNWIVTRLGAASRDRIVNEQSASDSSTTSPSPFLAKLRTCFIEIQLN
jgi:hypothetical protein